MSRVGYNINVQGMSQATIEKYVAQGTAHVLMGDPILAEHTTNNFKDKIIISRGDYPDDTATVPNDLVQRWQARNTPHVWNYWPNEPYPADENALLQSLVQLMSACAEAKVRVCIGNFAWQDFDPQDMQEGVWDEFLQAADDNREFVMVGGHEYTFGALPWGCAGENYKDMMLSPMPEGKWPSWETIQNAGPDNWHLFRWVPLYQRAQVLGIEMFDMVVTECFWDNPADTSSLATHFGLDANTGYGLPVQQVLFPKFWPQWDALTATQKQLQWAEDTYPDFVKGFCLFTVSNDAKWANFDIQRSLL